GHDAVMELPLTKEGVDPDFRGADLRTPLSWAAMSFGHNTAVKLLLSTNTLDPNHSDKYGRKILLWASENRYEIVVELLLAKDNINPNSMDRLGQTPLSCA
ncbi:hypothetical protein DM02DRAFT_469154, partial [Periconia macrospinosa]